MPMATECRRGSPGSRIARGKIERRYDADLVVLNERFESGAVWARGDAWKGSWETIDYERCARPAPRPAGSCSSHPREPRAVLGLPTGRTPIGMYERVVRECAREYRCFRDVTTFNLDEYAACRGASGQLLQLHEAAPLRSRRHRSVARAHPPRHGPRSRRRVPALRRRDSRRRRPRPHVPRPGPNGHIGFNEPGTPFDARTRVVELTKSTRAPTPSSSRAAPCRPRHHHGHRHDPRVATHRPSRCGERQGSGLGACAAANRPRIFRPRRLDAWGCDDCSRRLV